MNTKIITLLIVGMVALTTTAVFAGKNYNSSKSNTASIAIVNQQVGDILLRYGIGGAEINRVTDALAIGITEEDLKKTLIEIGIGEEGVNAVFTKLDELGAGFIKADDQDKAISTSVTGGTLQSTELGMDIFLEVGKTISTSDAGDISKDTGTVETEILSMDLTGSTPQPAQGTIRILTPEREVSILDTGDTLKAVDIFLDIEGEAKESSTEEGGQEETASEEASEGGGEEEVPARAAPRAVTSEIKTGLIDNIREDDKVVVRKLPGRTKYSNIVLKRGFISDPSLIKQDRTVFHDAVKSAIRDMKSIAPEERESLRGELQVSRQIFRENVQVLRQNLRENAKELRDNFRERVKTVIGHVDHGKTARIANVHGKGLRMLNRFRSAMDRFDHIIDRLESRVEKMKARGFQVDSFFDVETSIEEANNISVENAARMEELKAKYESLLLGENPQGVAKEAREISKELKTEIENLHDKLREIAKGLNAVNVKLAQ